MGNKSSYPEEFLYDITQNLYFVGANMKEAKEFNFTVRFGLNYHLWASALQYINGGKKNKLNCL